MKVKKLEKSALDAWVDDCVAQGNVHGVQARDERFVFAPLEKAADLCLGYDVTILPPKKYFLPQREVLNTYTKEDGFESVIEDEPFVLFGIHPYDMVAISQMDKIFEMDNPDVHYLSRRENATLVVSDIETMSENIFAGSMDTATVDEGFDILLTRIGDEYLLDIRTEKGAALAAGLADAPDASEEDLKKREQTQQSNREQAQRHKLDFDPKNLPEMLSKSYKHPIWDERAEQCHSCGSCNLVCPTCYCFNVCDDCDWGLEKVERRRIWDGCLLNDFALTAGGHNFRRHRAARYRHRYLRKGEYVPGKIDEIACIGCGRCISACTTKIANPVEVFNIIAEDSE